MQTKKTPNQIRVTLALLTFFFALTLNACNPALYKRPAEDFQTASSTLKDAYFLEWEISNMAQIEQGDLQDQVGIWTAPAGVSSTQLEKVSDRMAERRKEDIHEQLRPLREQAFAALEGYASTLVNLASDEPTEQIKSELNGLVNDLNGTLDQMSNLNLIGDTVGKMQKFTGPLQQYVAVLNQIIGIVSDIVRERAIIETIGKSNESILALLGVLKEEAAAAEDNALLKVSSAKEAINRFMLHDKFQQADNSIKATVLKRKAELTALEQQIASQYIVAAFDAAQKAQNALVEKALLKDPGDWTLRIKRFKKQVADTKSAIEKVKMKM